MSTKLTEVVKGYIRKETKARKIDLSGLYEDENIITGFFKTDTGEEGSFLYGKKTWASVVNVY